MKSANQKERELIIKLHFDDKKSSYQIADILGISQTKASFWIRRYKKTGSLLDKPRSGRPTPLKEEGLEEIKTLLKARLTKVDKSGFSSKEVLELMENKAKKKYTLRHAERIMHKIGLSLITPRVSHIRKDEKAQVKFRDEFKKTSAGVLGTFNSYF